MPITIDTYFKIKNSGPLAVIVITNIRATEKHTGELSCMYFFKCFIFIWIIPLTNSKGIKKAHREKSSSYSCPPATNVSNPEGVSVSVICLLKDKCSTPCFMIVTWSTSDRNGYTRSFLSLLQLESIAL